MEKLYDKLLRMIPGLLLAGIFLAGCDHGSMQGMIICTQVKPAQLKIDLKTGGNWRYFGQSRIVAIDPAKPGSIARILTKDFFAARSPEISFDGKRMLFSGQRNKGDRWQIYEQTLGKNDARPVIVNDQDCTDPAYLPDGNIIFSSRNISGDSKEETTLYTCGLNGCCLNRIAYHPNSDFASSMLDDGRITVISWQVFPDPTAPVYMTMRPDGTKSELYYKGGRNAWFTGRLRESAGGEIFFVESTIPNPEKGRLITIKRSRPLNSRQDLSSDIPGDFYSVYPQETGKLLVSYRESGTDRFGIYEFDTGTKKISDALLNDSEFSSIEPVKVASRPVPRNLPTEVNKDKTTGFLMCMDAGFSTMPVMQTQAGDQKTAFVQILGLNGLIRELPVEEDGSFFVDISANTPLRFVTLNDKKEVLRGPSAWMWMRPNERRGCVGCHENRELAPDNHVALAIKKLPVEVVVTGTRHEEEGTKGLEHN